MKRKSGLADDVIVDFIIRHEITHCVESSDKKIFAMERLMGEKINQGQLIAGEVDTENQIKSSEEFADAVAILSLITEDRLGMSDLSTLARIRSNEKDSDSTHDSSGFLMKVKYELEQNPSIIEKWKVVDSLSIRVPPSKIQCQIDWLEPLWKMMYAS